jgi:malonyl-CoA O-methyltransferase
MRALPANEGYRLWAPTYSDETAISFLENKLVQGMTPPLAGLRLLDAGCGTGRRLRATDAARATGLDQSAEMLAAGGQIAGVDLVRGNVCEMPFDNRSFDVAWCRLVVGHLPSVERAYSELARVTDFGGAVIVSDFHPAAYEAGHRRTFRFADERIELEHHVHRAQTQIHAARAVGLAHAETREAKIGDEVRTFYERAGRLDAYPADRGLPVVLALAFRKVR